MKVLRDYENAIEILIPSEVKRVVLTDKVVSEAQGHSSALPARILWKDFFNTSPKMWEQESPRQTCRVGRKVVRVRIT